MGLFKRARASYALSLILCAVLLGAMAVPALAAKDTPRSDRAAEAHAAGKAKGKGKDAKDAEKRQGAGSANGSSRGQQAPAAKADNASSASQSQDAATSSKKAEKQDRAQAKAAGENSPAGNKGSMKVRPVGTEAHPPRNDAHLPCTVQVDFYGSPHSGATLTAVSHAPTAPTGQTLLTETMTFSQSSPNPRGNELVGTTTLDFTSVVDGLTYHEQQGYHVKLTAVQDGPQGGDVKHKVFWIDCGAPAADEATGSVAEDDIEDDAENASSAVLGSEAEVEVEDDSVDAAATATAADVDGDVLGLSGSTEHTQVAGVMVEREMAAADVDGRVLGQSDAVGARSARVLAATGLGVLTLALLGLLSLGGGAGLLRRFRR